ncbi:MAG: hypothetical protein BRD30_02285, partial [Bacteroidetes bacterium QH_2_63_10]
MPRRLLVYVILLTGLGILVGGPPAHVQAQQIRIQADDQPLEPALTELRSQAGLDLVYADRLVQGRTTSCTYVGPDADEAL